VSTINVCWFVVCGVLVHHEAHEEHEGRRRRRGILTAKRAEGAKREVGRRYHEAEGKDGLSLEI
jgi:hypothetical protein